jgi:hypothetical protein
MDSKKAYNAPTFEFWGSDELDKIEANMSGGGGTPSPNISYASSHHEFQYNDLPTFSMSTRFGIALSVALYELIDSADMTKSIGTLKIATSSAAKGVNYPYPSHNSIMISSISCMPSSNYLTFWINDSAEYVGCTPPVSNSSIHPIVTGLLNIVGTVLSLVKYHVISLVGTTATIIASLISASSVSRYTGNYIYKQFSWSPRISENTQYLQIMPTIPISGNGQWGTSITYSIFGTGWEVDWITLNCVYWRGVAYAPSSTTLAKALTAESITDARATDDWGYYVEQGESSDNVMLSIPEGSADKEILVEITNNNIKRSELIVEAFSSLKDSSEECDEIIQKHTTRLQEMNRIKVMLQDSTVVDFDKMLAIRDCLSASISDSVAQDTNTLSR